MAISSNKVSIVLTVSLIAGQIVKIPLVDLRGLAILDITIIFLALLGLKKMIFQKKSLDFKNLPLNFYFLSLFLVIAGVSLLLNPLNLNFDQFLISGLYFFRLVLFIVIFYLIIKKILVFNTSNIFIYSGFSLALLGILQFIFIPDLRFLRISGWDPHFFRAVSTFLDPNFLGGFLVLSLLSLYYTEIEGKKIKLSLLILVYFCLALTFSRSSYLFFFVSFFTLGILTKSAKIILSSILLSIVLLATFYIYEISIATPRNIDRNESAQSRLDTWTQGINLFLKHPLFGVGFNSYKYALEKYNLADKVQINTRGSASNDSSLLFVLSTTGILGFGLFFSFIISTLHISGIKNRKDKSGQIIFCGLISLLVNSFFVNSLFYPAILTWLILYVGSLKQ